MIILFLLLSCSLFAESFKDYKSLKAVFHVHSYVSYDGKYSFKEIANLAESKGIEAIGFADHDFIKFEYGLPILRNLLKRKLEFDSISTYGFKKYFDEINKISDESPGIVLIPGVESAAFYYYQGKPFTKNFFINDWHKHFLIFGLKYDELKNLPVFYNKRISTGNIEILLLWPIFFILFGILWVFYSVIRYLRIRNKHILVKVKPINFISIIIIFFGIIGFLENYPFTPILGPYEGSFGIKPYQILIDYVNSKNGLIYWAHPEAKSQQRFDAIIARTNPYQNDLLKSDNYTGFCAWWEGSNCVKIGSIWDKVLIECLNGIRKKPVWIISELDYRYEGLSGTYIDSHFVNILTKEKSRNACLSALKNGRAYIQKNSSKVLLNDFAVSAILLRDSSAFGLEPSASQGSAAGIPTAGTIGSTVLFEDSIKIKIDLSCKDKTEITVNLIKNGSLFKNFEGKTNITIEDKPGNNSYYRLEILENKNQTILTNPIFVRVLKNS